MVAAKEAGKTLSYAASPPLHGLLAGAGPSYIYTPSHAWHGLDTFRVTIGDGSETIDVPVMITVASENVAPVPTDDAFATPENTALAVPTAALLANDSAFDPSLLKVVSVQGATNGTVALSGGMVTFTPAAQFTGIAMFSYTESDGTNAASAKVHVSVSFVDAAPVATADFATTAEDTAIAIPMSTLIANDTDEDHQTLEVTAVSGATHGTAAISGTTVVFTPAANYDGDGTFEYTVSDGFLTDSAVVTITVTPVNDPPVATDGSATIDEDSSGAVVLAATDIDSPTLTYVTTPPTHGTLSGTAPNLTYTPTHFFSGSDSFTFSANDGQASSNVATVSITVTHEIECGDGIVEGTEQCDDGNNIDGDGCESDCTITVAGAVCGNGILEGSEQCDDGNTTDGDGCSHDCVIEYCGDGKIDLGLGETCDDGNTVSGDGCDSNCHVEPWTTTTPVAVSGELSCTTGTPNAAREVAVDGGGTVYAVMLCGTTAQVIVSTDRGYTFSAPIDMGETTVALVAVGAGGAGRGYVAMILEDGTVRLRTTDDQGATFSAAATLGTATSFSTGLSLEAFNDTLYVGFSENGGIDVLRSFDDGATFASTDVGMSIAFFDVLYDRVQSTVIVAADTPNFHIRSSSDQGVSFATEVNPPGLEYYSDWAIGNGEVFVSGTDLGPGFGNSTGLFVIPTDALDTSTEVVGLPTDSTFQTRVVAAAVNGDAFVGTQLDAGGVELDRLPYGASSFDAPRALSSTATGIVIGSLPGSAGAAVEYVDGGVVYVTVQAY